MNGSSPVRILIADDHPVTREGFASLIKQRTDMCVVAEAGNGEEAVALYRRHQPDVALLDRHMPQLDGLAALQAIRGEFPQARVMMLSTFDAQDDIYRALQNGARSYLLKDTQPTEMFHAIAQVAAGQTYLPAYISSQLAERMRVPELTAREHEILTNLVAGRSNQEIGNKLFIAEGTVKVHVASIFKKMGVSDRTQAVTLALKRGMAQLT